jgi:NADH-quinone oxidoreductase subunit J
MSLETVSWWLMAVLAVACAVGMLSAKNPVHSALWLVGNFSAIAVIFLLLSAPVLFAIQLIVYAGAIMVLFIFVIMFFMSPKARQWLRPALKGQLVFGGVLVVAFLLLLIWGIGVTGVGMSSSAPASDGLRVSRDVGDDDVVGMGNPRPLGNWLFSWQVLPFELTSILLLIAMIGALMVARDLRSEGREDVPETAAVVDMDDSSAEVEA